MILYHGFYMPIDDPDLKHSRTNLDFGVAFYTTPLYEQAHKWCNRFEKSDQGKFVSSYELDESAFSDLKILKFEAYSEEWLDFIIRCRKGNDASDWNLVIGSVANDKVINTVELFLDGLIDKVTAIGRLKFEKPDLQIAFRTPISLQYLHFLESEKL